MNPGKFLKRNIEDLAKAVTLRSPYRKAFNFFTRVLNYPLPSEHGIQHRLAAVQ